MQERVPTILVSDGWETDENDALVEVVIPSTVETYNTPTKVTFLGDSLSTMFSGIKELDAPNCTTLSNRACRNITTLETVSFASLVSYTVTSGGLGAFRGCTGLKYINFPSLTNITCTGGGSDGTGLFFGCTGLTSINLPALTTLYISNTGGGTMGTFGNCTGLVSVTFPSLTTVTNISTTGWHGEFYGCTSLATVVFPVIQTITESHSGSGGGGMFYNCKGLRTVQLGSEGHPVNSISSITFNQCTQSNLTITLYTTGGASLSGSPWGATNATIVYETA